MSQIRLHHFAVCANIKTASDSIFFRRRTMIVVRLREAMEAYRHTYGKRWTYSSLSRATGISVQTLNSIANTKGYGTSFHALDTLCRVLKTEPCQILAYDPSRPHPKSPRKTKKAARPKAPAKKRKKKTKGKSA